MTDEPTTTEAASDEAAPPAPAASAHEPEVTDVLVEEVSIDGMCGVY